MIDTFSEHPIFNNRPIGTGVSAAVPGRATLRTMIYAGVALFGIALQRGADGRTGEGIAGLPVVAVTASMELGTPWDRPGAVEPDVDFLRVSIDSAAQFEVVFWLVP